MNFSNFEHVVFSTKRGFDAAILNIKGKLIGGAIVLNPNAVEQFRGWKDVQANFVEAKTNKEGVIGYFLDIPVVVQGDDGMYLTIIPKKAEEYIRLSQFK